MTIRQSPVYFTGQGESSLQADRLGQGSVMKTIEVDTCIPVPFSDSELLLLRHPNELRASLNRSTEQQLLEKLREIRESRIIREQNSNNPDFYLRALKGNEQFFMPFDELVARADKHQLTNLQILEQTLFTKGQDDFAVQSFKGKENAHEIRTSLEFPIYEDATFKVVNFAVPHRRKPDIGSFPGEPTPLLTATAVTEALVRLGLWPGAKIPEMSLYYPTTLDHPIMGEINERMMLYCDPVIAMSVMSEAQPLALKILHTVREYNPEAIFILGGSFYDGTNPLAMERGATKLGIPFPEEAVKRSRSIAFFGEPEERIPGVFVVAGDGQYLYAKLLQILSDAPQFDVSNAHRFIEARRDEFSLCPGSGEIFWFNPDTKQVEHAAASGQEIDRNLEPFITRRVTNNRFWIFNREETAQVMFGDGCPESCGFCDESLARKFAYDVKKVGYRTPENMLTEISRIVDAGIFKFFFDDSYFLQRPSHLKELFEGLIELRKIHPQIEWGCQTTMDSVIKLSRAAGTIPLNGVPNYLQLLKDSGCSYIYTGLEGADPAASTVSNVTKATKRSAIQDNPNASWIERFDFVARLLQRHEIRLGASLIFGLGEDLTSTEELFKKIHEYHFLGVIPDAGIALNMATLYPGTQDYLNYVVLGDRSADFRDELVAPVKGFESLSQYSMGDATLAKKVRDMAYEICGSAIVGYSSGDVAAGRFVIQTSAGPVYCSPHDFTSWPIQLPREIIEEFALTALRR